MNRDDLERLSKEQLVELVLKLQRPAKTSRTSSKPPSGDRKARRRNAKPGGAKPGHKGHFRALAENPDETVAHRPASCPACRGEIDDSLAGEVIGEYDEIELPPITPFIRRHLRLAVTCPHCQALVEADLPAAALGSPFGPRLHGLALYLKTFQALSFARLRAMFDDVFGLKISQGALAKMLARSHKPFAVQKETIIERLRRAEMVASDETGIRIEAINSYQWVFLSPDAVVHEARMSRAGQVVRDMMAGHKPKIWLSDAYSAQQNHGAHQQPCLAHLARDVAYGLEASDDDLPFRLELWLDKLFVLARNIESYAASTLATKKRQAENALADILRARPACDVAEKLRAKFARASPRLLTFLDFPGEVEVTNNACERALRPAVIQRKVTNGFRAMWAAEGDCAVRTVTDTAKLSGKSPYQTIIETLA